MSRKANGAKSALVAALLIAGCGTNPSNPAMAPDASANEQPSFTVRSKDGRTRLTPLPCGPEIPFDAVQVLDVRGEEHPRDVVASTLPQTRFMSDDYILIDAPQPGLEKNRERAQQMSARLGCDVLVVGDFVTFPNYDFVGGRGSVVRYLKAAWGTAAP